MSQMPSGDETDSLSDSLSLGGDDTTSYQDTTTIVGEDSLGLPGGGMMLNSVSSGGGSSELCYNTTTTKTGYYYFGDDMLCDYRGSTSSDLIGNYVYANGERVAEFRGVWADIRYYLTDHLGSVVATINGSGTLRNSYEYLPWGIMNQSTVADQEKFNYTGHVRDEELGTNYLYCGARYYDPKLRTFLAVDPMYAKYPGLGTYVYCKDDPMKNIDADGKKTTWAEIKGLLRMPAASVRAYDNGQTAMRMTFNPQNAQAANGGIDDARRHALWSAMNARDLGEETARQIGYNHENFGGNPPDDQAMDLHNNDVGIKIGLENPKATDEQLLNLINAEARPDGELQTEVRAVDDKTRQTNKKKIEGYDPAKPGDGPRTSAHPNPVP